ncbi:MAG: NAD(P)/FAD-dependent oxidoreductase [Candidatus Coproplasma sp.]
MSIVRIDNIKLPVDRPETDLISIVQRKLHGNIKYFKILKKSLDARNKRNVFWLYSVACSTQPVCEEVKTFERLKTAPTVAVIGAGPAGLFCALRLIEHGFKPVIIERGERVEERRKSCSDFFNNRILNEESNVQFGEGGAGAFSDGKLLTRTKDGLNSDVLAGFVRFGAPEEILYLNKPHVGSDRLYGVLQSMRKYIESEGGKYLFNTKLIGLEQEQGALTALKLKEVKSGEESLLPVSCAVLAVGHSARDTFEMLRSCGVYMEPRDFAVGVRIEHLSKEISFAQYGQAAKYLPAADYGLVSHAGERTVFTFCMCPGGVVIPAASEKGGVVVNGMSDYARDGVNSNSALMVQMRREDFGADDLFAGVRFQQRLEQAAFSLGGGNFKAPVQLWGDFEKDRVSDRFNEVNPTYAAGVNFAPLDALLPEVAVSSLKAAVPDMAKRLKGFDSPSAVMTGVESRFSSPVKILRDTDGQSVSLKNMYPCGEGSGYSGGITSSAADGLWVAEKLFERFRTDI